MNRVSDLSEAVFPVPTGRVSAQTKLNAAVYQGTRSFPLLALSTQPHPRSVMASEILCIACVNICESIRVRRFVVGLGGRTALPLTLLLAGRTLHLQL